MHQISTTITNEQDKGGQSPSHAALALSQKPSPKVQIQTPRLLAGSKLQRNHGDIDNEGHGDCDGNVNHNYNGQGAIIKQKLSLTLRMGGNEIRMTVMMMMMIIIIIIMIILH